MESKKVKIIVAIAFSVFLLSGVALVFAAFIYCGITGLTEGSGVACAVGTAVILGAVDPLFLWIIAWAAGFILLFVILLLIVLHAKRKKRRRLAAQAQAESGLAAAEIGSDIAGEAAPTYEEELRAFLAGEEADVPEQADEEQDAAVAQPEASVNDEMLAKYIRDVNEKADEFRGANGTLAALTQKRTDLKFKAAQLQKRLFKAHSLEFINRCSMTLNKIYKLMSKYDARITELKEKKYSLRDELAGLRRSACTYISIYKVPLSVVTGVEDDILLDIALSKKLVEESGYFPKTIVCSVSSDIKDKRGEITNLEAELVYWKQSLENAEGDDPRLDALIKILDAEEKLEAARDELGELMCRITEEEPHKSVEEITSDVKSEVVSGSGIVTRDMIKLAAKRK